MTSAPQNLHDALNVIRAMHNALLAFRHPDFNLVAPGREGEFDARVKAVLALSAPLILADRDAAAMPVQLAVADSDEDHHRRNLELAAMPSIASTILHGCGHQAADIGFIMRLGIDGLLGGSMTIAQARKIAGNVEASLSTDVDKILTAMSDGGDFEPGVLSEHGKKLRDAIERLIQNTSGLLQAAAAAVDTAAAEPLPKINAYAGLNLGDVVRTDDGVRWTIEAMGSALDGVQCIRWDEPMMRYVRNVFSPHALTVERKNHPEPLLPPGALVPGKPGSDAHASDCAVHNAPAEKPGPCDCADRVPGLHVNGAASVPRVTAADVEASIASEYYFTGFEGFYGASGRKVTAEQLAAAANGPLSGVMHCVLVLKNGQVTTGEAFLQDLSKPDPAGARVAARCRAFDKAYDMVVYGERERLAARVQADGGSK